MFEELIALLLLSTAFAAPSSQYPYKQPFASLSSTPSYIMKPPPPLSNGYKVQLDQTTSNKVKKEYNNGEYLFVPDDNGHGRPQTFNSYNSDEYSSSTPGPNVISFPYAGQITPDMLPPPPFVPIREPYQPTASNKLYTHHGHDFEHYITDVAGHKLKHVGEILESGVLTKPLVHQLSFAKSAILQLLGVIGPLSAIKTIHVVAKASDPHLPHHHESEHPLLPTEHADSFPSSGPGHRHYPSTLIGMIMHFAAQLSRFNIDAKLHLIPNLLKMVTYASGSSGHSSGHH